MQAARLLGLALAGAVYHLMQYGLAATAQAQPATLTLACKGTMTMPAMPDEKPEPISTGIIVNFTTRTVQGFDRFVSGRYVPDIPVTITAANDTTITFSGHEQHLTSQYRGIEGGIDRVTGDVQATYTITNPETVKIVGQFEFALQCRPTQRMF